MRKLKFWIRVRICRIKRWFWRLIIKLKLRNEQEQPKPEGKPVVWIRWKSLEDMQAIQCEEEEENAQGVQEEGMDHQMRGSGGVSDQD